MINKKVAPRFCRPLSFQFRNHESPHRSIEEFIHNTLIEMICRFVLIQQADRTHFDSKKRNLPFNLYEKLIWIKHFYSKIVEKSTKISSPPYFLSMGGRVAQHYALSLKVCSFDLDMKNYCF